MKRNYHIKTAFMSLRLIVLFLSLVLMGALGISQFQRELNNQLQIEKAHLLDLQRGEGQ